MTWLGARLLTWDSLGWETEVAMSRPGQSLVLLLIHSELVGVKGIEKMGVV